MCVCVYGGRPVLVSCLQDTASLTKHECMDSWMHVICRLIAFTNPSASTLQRCQRCHHCSNISTDIWNRSPAPWRPPNWVEFSTRKKKQVPFWFEERERERGRWSGGVTGGRITGRGARVDGSWGGGARAAGQLSPLGRAQQISSADGNRLAESWRTRKPNHSPPSQSITN